LGRNFIILVFFSCANILDRTWTNHPLVVKLLIVSSLIHSNLVVTWLIGHK
jgi:hypothetical protein